MKKLAAFVEGQTEQLFIEKLLEEAAGKRRIAIEKRQASGGQSGKRTFRFLHATTTAAEQQYYAQIIDCGTDNRVKSDVVENYDGLVSTGFQTIFAIRDVYPSIAFSDIPSLRTGLRLRVKTKPVEVKFILGIMEIETWFIAEYTHFQRLDSRLTPERIQSQLGFDPRSDDIQLRDRKSTRLNSSHSRASRMPSSA